MWKCLPALSAGSLLAILALACGGAAQPTATKAPAPAAPTPTRAQAAPTPTSAPAPKAGGILKTFVNYNPPHWDKDLVVSYQTQTVTNYIYSKLLHYRTTYGTNPYAIILEGDLAEKWSTPDPSTFVFTLRKGVKFQDKPPVNGREVVASDVKATFDRILDPNVKSPNRSLWGPLKSVEVLDESTVRFTTSSPYAPFLTFIGSDYGQVVPKELIAEGRDMKKPTDNVGSGPWTLLNYQRDVKYEWRKNPTYWKQGLPYLEGVTTQIIPERAVQLAAIKSAELDLGAVTGEYKDVEDIQRANPGLTAQTIRAYYWPRLYMRTDQAPFKDIRVRQALSMTLDRKKLADVVVGGRAVPEGIIPLHLGDFATAPDKYPPQLAKLWQRDLATAKRLVAEAGYPDGVSVKLETTNIYGATWVSQVEAVVAQLREGPFKVEPVFKEYGAYISTTYLGKFDSLAFGLTTPPADPDEILYAFYSPGDPRNASIVNDSELTPLIQQQRAIMDRAERIKFIKERIEPLIAERLYYVPTINDETWSLVHPWVKDYTFHATPSYGAGRVYETVWLDKR